MSTASPEIYELTVNGRSVSCAGDKSLLRFLRDDLKLMAVKDGCSQGGCGTCTIIIDGVAKKACMLKTKRLQGATIITPEGLSLEEQEAFVYAFGMKGSVQCGFCIPGMVMSAKALIDQNPNPTEEDVKAAIKTNICRCTGYKKIIEGILMVAAILRGEIEMHPEDEYASVGARMRRRDVREKVLGFGQYVDDIEMEGMVHGSCIRSPYPRALVKRIDASKALEMPGVLAVLTAEDVPHNKVGHIQQDWDVFIAEGDITRTAADAVCMVVAETEEILAAAKAAVEVDFEELECVTSIEEAKAEGAPQVHAHAPGNLCQKRHVQRGDAKKALENSKYVVSHHFSTPFTEHAFLEPECAIAFPYREHDVKVLTTDQGVYDTRKEISIMLGWDPDRIVVENKLVGGGFGGKEDVSVQHIAVLAALKVQRPVKVKFTRDESLAFHPKRHPMEADFTVGCDENGIITGLDCEINFDTGGYASLCGPVLERACTHAPGPYMFENTDIRGFGYYTNNPPAGAFRGFGVCQSNFAMEMCLTLLAEKVGISAWEIRYRNAIRPGKVLPNGQIADRSTALIETLEAVKDKFYENEGRCGIACAMKNAGVGVGLPDKGRCRALVKDGKIEIYTAASDIGQGCFTVFIQVACETLNLPYSRVVDTGSNSELAPDSGTTSGSRQTLLSGEAVRMVCEQVADAMRAKGFEPGVEGLEALEGEEFFAEYFEPTDPIVSDKPNPKSHIAYAFATHLAVLDEEGKVSDIYAAHDSGTVVNPISIQGQIEGGVLMSMGYALTEDLKLNRGIVKAKFGSLGLLKSTDIPNIEAIYVERNEKIEAAYGAKGIGEITSIPTAPAIAGAYYALDHDLRCALPLRDTAYSKPKKKFN